MGGMPGGPWFPWVKWDPWAHKGPFGRYIQARCYATAGFAGDTSSEMVPRCLVGVSISFAHVSIELGLILDPCIKKSMY